MADLGSLAKNLAYNAPDLAGGTGRIAQIISSRRTASKTAGRIEGIGNEEARLRAIQGARLLGAQRASFAGRGVSGGSQAAIQGETAGLEQLDVGRILTNAKMNADEVRNRGLASALAATLGLTQDAIEFGQAGKNRRDLKQQQKVRLPPTETILPASPEIQVPGLPWLGNRRGPA